jgi:hypothetical protein
MSKTSELDLLELEAELTWEDRLRRWGRRVWAAMLGLGCPGCESLERQADELRKQLAEERAKSARLRDLRESEPVPKVTDADLAAAFGTLLPEQEPRYALQPRVVDLRALEDALLGHVSDTATEGPWQRAEPMHRSSGSTSPPPALYQPPGCSCRCHEAPEEPSGPLPYAEVARMWPNPCKGPLPEATVAMAKRMAHERPGGGLSSGG